MVDFIRRSWGIILLLCEEIQRHENVYNNEEVDRSELSRKF